MEWPTIALNKYTNLEKLSVCGGDFGKVKMTLGQNHFMRCPGLASVQISSSAVKKKHLNGPLSALGPIRS